MRTQLKSTRGFTLIELLTVIGILAVLVTFSMAGLNKARIRAYEVQDISALRQLGTAFHIMMNDLDEVKPNDFFDPLDKLWIYTADSADQGAAWNDRIAKTAAARKLLSSTYWKKLNTAYVGGEQYPRSYSVNAAQSFFPSPPPDSGQPDWERLSVRSMKILAQPQVVLLFMTYANGTPGIAYMGAANPIYSGINKTGYSAQYGRTPILFVDGRAVVADLSREFNDAKTWGE
jgi:prepilin-type N-terminal cleavage/methylation domain-containing protein